MSNADNLSSLVDAFEFDPTTGRVSAINPDFGGLTLEYYAEHTGITIDRGEPAVDVTIPAYTGTNASMTADFTIVTAADYLLAVHITNTSDPDVYSNGAWIATVTDAGGNIVASVNTLATSNFQRESTRTLALPGLTAQVYTITVELGTNTAVTSWTVDSTIHSGGIPASVSIDQLVRDELDDLYEVPTTTYDNDADSFTIFEDGEAVLTHHNNLTVTQTEDFDQHTSVTFTVGADQLILANFQFSDYSALLTGVNSDGDSELVWCSQGHSACHVMVTTSPS